MLKSRGDTVGGEPGEESGIGVYGHPWFLNVVVARSGVMLTMRRHTAICAVLTFGSAVRSKTESAEKHVQCHGQCSAHSHFGAKRGEMSRVFQCKKSGTRFGE